MKGAKEVIKDKEEVIEDVEKVIEEKEDVIKDEEEVPKDAEEMTVDEQVTISEAVDKPPTPVEDSLLLGHHDDTEHGTLTESHNS